MNSENKLIIHSNENDKEINHYGKLLLAYKDYQLMEAIKLLPDDMIKEIKKYVMNPYKFMPELKLYKFPVFKNSIDGKKIMRVMGGEFQDQSFFSCLGFVSPSSRNNTNRNYNAMPPKLETYEMTVSIRSGETIKKLHVRELNKGWNSWSGWGSEIDRVDISSIILHDICKLNYYYYELPKYRVSQYLKDLNIKGRTKLIKFYDKTEMGSKLLIQAVIKGS